MSIKSKLLAKIDRNAQKIREKRVTAANNKSLEDAVFNFFRNIEESRKLHNGERYDHVLYAKALTSLRERITGFDQGTKLVINFVAGESDDLVRGVTIWWSQAYIAKNNVDPSLYIDVSAMLFF
jgi:hypothetical protein